MSKARINASVSNVITADTIYQKTLTGDGQAIVVKGSYTGNPNIFEVKQSASDGYMYVRDAAGNTSQITGYPSGYSIIRGKVTTPEKPAFHAYRSTNPGNTTSDAALAFDTVFFNNGGHYNSSNGVFTSPVSGYYAFGVSTNFSNDSNPKQFIFMKNGSAQARIYADMSVSWTPVSASHTFYLAAGDTLQIYYRGRPDYGISWCNFSGHLIG